MSSALLVGATGLVGQSCLQQLLAAPAWKDVHVLVRRPMGIEHPKLREHVVDFEALMEADSLPCKTDALFLTLGTTHKAAGSKAAFRRVDHDYVLHIAGLAAADGVQQILAVSALGAKPKALSHYSHVKGQVEEGLCKLNVPTLHIFRPSLLLGDRQEHRPGEAFATPFARVFSPLLQGGAKKYRPIHADDVAEKMVSIAGQNLIGQHIHYFHA